MSEAAAAFVADVGDAREGATRTRQRLVDASWSAPLLSCLGASLLRGTYVEVKCSGGWRVEGWDVVSLLKADGGEKKKRGHTQSFSFAKK
jgi:hypothetical protein